MTADITIPQALAALREDIVAGDALIGWLMLADLIEDAIPGPIRGEAAYGLDREADPSELAEAIREEARAGRNTLHLSGGDRQGVQVQTAKFGGQNWMLVPRMRIPVPPSRKRYRTPPRFDGTPRRPAKDWGFDE